MKIAVVGATGHAGLQVAEQALARGDDVIALARHPEALPRLGPGMVSAAADVLHRAVLTQPLPPAAAVPAGPRAGQPFLQRRMIIPILERVFGATYADMRRMEALLRGSDLDWVCLRPPRLISKKPTGRYRLDASRPLPKASSITYADLATALLDSLSRPDLYRRAAYVASRRPGPGRLPMAAADAGLLDAVAAAGDGR